MNVLLVAPFINPYEVSSSRVDKLKRLLEKNNIDTYLITTDFNHASKKSFTIDYSRSDLWHIKVPRYKKNISLKRFYSHTVFAVKLLIFLFSKKNTKNFDVIYCTAPTILSALSCMIYAKKNSIKVVVDVIDLWPNSFLVLLPFKKLFKIFLFPWYLSSFFIYKFADKLFAESDKYAKYVQKFSKNKVEYINLGIDRSLIKENIIKSKLQIKKDKNKVYVCYAGSLGNSYDFDVILNALRKLKEKGVDNYHFLFIGNGDKKQYISDYIEKYELPAEITGFLTYVDYIKYLSICDIGLNSFKKNTKVVYSYKFNDYLGTGLAVLNSLSGETEDIIKKYSLGYTYDYEQNKLENKLELLICDTALLNKIKCNSVEYVKKAGDYEIGYQKIIDYILTETTKKGNDNV